MSKGIGPVLLLAGGAALLLATRKKTTSAEGPPHIPDTDDEDLTDAQKCDRFLRQIYVESTQEDEMPIAEVAVTEQILPRLHYFAQNVIKEKGVVDTDEYPKFMARLALEEVIPVCTFEINAAGELISPDDERARKIYNSLIPLARQIAIEENALVGVGQPGFESGEKELPQAGFEERE